MKGRYSLIDEYAPSRFGIAADVIAVGLGVIVCMAEIPEGGDRDSHPGGARSSVVTLDGLAESVYRRRSVEQMLEMAFRGWVKVPSPLSDTGLR